jgi:hypothetical protein
MESGRTNFILRIKERETHLPLLVHDDDDDDDQKMWKRKKQRRGCCTTRKFYYGIELIRGGGKKMKRGFKENKEWKEIGKLCTFIAFKIPKNFTIFLCSFTTF